METNSSKPILSGWFRRSFATAIDFFLLYLVLRFLGLSFSVSVGLDFTGFEIVFQNWTNALFFYFLLVSYFGSLEGFFGSTLGKFLVKEKVVGLQGDKASISQTLFRNLLKPIDFFFGIGLLLLSPKKQTIGDRIAKTVVIIIKVNEIPETIQNEPVSIVRKILGVLFVINAIILSYCSISSIPKINDVNMTGRSYFRLIKKGVLSNNLSDTYQASSEELKQQLTLEEFQEPLLKYLAKDNRFKSLLINANNLLFYKWKFQNNAAYLVGETEKKQTIEFRLLKENDKWKLVYFNIH